MKAISVCLALCGIVLLSGCLYPNELMTANQAPPNEYITVVQSAVDAYRQKTGVLPIKNSEMDTPIYEKYVIDFKRLKDQHVLSTIPANAFENGGTNLYVLVHVETKPEVKLLDLRSYQQVGDLQKQVVEYRNKHGGELPFGEPVAEHFHWLDFAKLGVTPPEIRSPYSRQTLNVLIHDSGQLAIDYAPEIMRVMQQKNAQSVDPKQDLREILVAESYYVPALSYPYHWLNNEPVVSVQ